MIDNIVSHTYRAGDIVASIVNTENFWVLKNVSRHRIDLGLVMGLRDSGSEHSFPDVEWSIDRAFRECLIPAPLAGWALYYGDNPAVLNDAIERGAISDLGQKELAA